MFLMLPATVTASIVADGKTIIIHENYSYFASGQLL